jgi:glucose/arabinose dehydrogenase
VYLILKRVKIISMKENYHLLLRILSKRNFVKFNSSLTLLFLSLLLCFSACKKESDLGGQSTQDEGAGNRPALAKKALELRPVASGLASPLGLVEAPDGSHRLFIWDQVGKVYIVDSGGTMLSSPFLDISANMVTLMPGYDERGLTGFAFHPQFASNGRFFVYYQAPPINLQYDHRGRVSEFTASVGSNVANAGSEQVILEWDHPQFNHDGGTIAFGPDGYLYIAIGDGGGANDTGFAHVADWYGVNMGGNGQDIDSNLLGNILRIDVNSGSPYAIPPDNPFVSTTHRPEIWAYGMRNPYRFSFDMEGSQRLIAMDAGQNLYEEINVIERGNNYGWNVKEGDECFDAANPLQELPSCPDVDPLGNRLIDPVLQLNNWMNPEGGQATTIIAGHVYRGDSLAGYQGKYIFGTFSQTPTTADGELFVAHPHGNGMWAYSEITLASHPGDIGYYLKGFGQDSHGEIYLTVSGILGPSGTSGQVFKLVLAP